MPSSLKNGWILCCVALAVAAPDIRSEDDNATIADRYNKFTEMKRRLVRESETPFAEPPAISSVGGLLSTALEVKLAQNRVDGNIVWLRSYNGGLVGPTLRVRPGDHLKVTLKNLLPKGTEPPAHGMAPTVPHGFNITNLHTHGLHVSPMKHEDNVFVTVGPGEKFDYSIKIPKDHPAGTFWYHAHRHGSVALQLASGMAGLLIVQGGMDDVKEIRCARERVFVFQQLLFRTQGIQKGEIDPEQVYVDKPDPKVVYTDTTINGVSRPVIYLGPGEIERWRFLHAGLAETLNLALVKDAGSAEKDNPVNLNQIAVDGLPLGTLNPTPNVLLQPGNRSDVLSPPLEAGTYFLVNQNVPAANSVTVADQPKNYLAKIVVDRPAQKMNLPDPTALTPFALPALPDRKPDVFRTFRFKQAGPNFTINGKPFDPSCVGVAPQLGAFEEWALISDAGNHPFHIHVNPFAVLRKNQDGKENAVWGDTVLITPKNPLTIRMQFNDFPGKTVLHCHNLRHEDQGMMMTVQIEPKGGAAKAGLPEVPCAAPGWTLLNQDNKSRSLAEFKGRNVLLLFVRGMDCVHCRRQLEAVADRRSDLAGEQLAIVIISPDEVDRLNIALSRSSPALQSLSHFLSDPELTAFRRYGCVRETALHGVFLIDGQGTLRWRRIGEEPFMDVDTILRSSREILPKTRPSAN